MNISSCSAAAWADISQYNGSLDNDLDDLYDSDQDEINSSDNAIESSVPRHMPTAQPVLGQNGRMSKHDHLTSIESIDEAYFCYDAKSKLRKPACRCASGNCVNQFSKIEIKHIRSYLWRDRDEAAVTVFLSKIIGADKDIIHDAKGHISKTNRKFFFSCLATLGDGHGSTKRVCSFAYNKIYGISNNKYQAAKRFNASGELFFVHGRAASPSVKAPKSEAAAAFIAFHNDMDTDRLTDSTRYRSNEDSRDLVYQHEFLPLFKSIYPLADPPAVDLFRKISNAEQFSDVKKAGKHAHAKCKDCGLLKAMRKLWAGRSGSVAAKNYKKSVDMLLQHKQLHQGERQVCLYLTLYEPSNDARMLYNIIILHDSGTLPSRLSSPFQSCANLFYNTRCHISLPNPQICSSPDVKYEPSAQVGARSDWLN
jgi:hypothetical protein